MCTRFRTDTAQCQVTCPSGHPGISAQLSCWTVFPSRSGNQGLSHGHAFLVGCCGGGGLPSKPHPPGQGGAGRKDRHAGPEARPGTQRTVLEAAPASVGRMCREGSFSSNLGTKPVASTQLQALTRTRCPARGGLRWASPRLQAAVGNQHSSQPPSVPSSVFVFTSYRGLSDDHPPAGAWRGHTFHFWTPRPPWLSPQGAAEKADSQRVHGIRATERGGGGPRHPRHMWRFCLTTHPVFQEALWRSLTSAVFKTTGLNFSILPTGLADGKPWADVSHRVQENKPRGRLSVHKAVTDAVLKLARKPVRMNPSDPSLQAGTHILSHCFILGFQCLVNQTNMQGC